MRWVRPGSCDCAASGHATPPTTKLTKSPVQALFDELRLNGFIEGQNLVIVSEGFEATDDRLAERAQSLIDARPDVIVSGPELPLRTLQKLTQTVPLVGMTEDMVGERLVTSLARPGGNVTSPLERESE